MSPKAVPDDQDRPQARRSSNHCAFAPEIREVRFTQQAEFLAVVRGIQPGFVDGFLTHDGIKEIPAFGMWPLAARSCRLPGTCANRRPGQE